MAGYHYVHPHQSVIRAGEGEGAHQWEERVAFERPENTCIEDAQLSMLDSVINYVDAQVGVISPAIEGRLAINP